MEEISEGFNVCKICGALGYKKCGVPGEEYISGDTNGPEMSFLWGDGVNFAHCKSHSDDEKFAYVKSIRKKNLSC